MCNRSRNTRIPYQAGRLLGDPDLFPIRLIGNEEPGISAQSAPSGLSGQSGQTGGSQESDRSGGRTTTLGRRGNLLNPKNFSAFGR